MQLNESVRKNLGTYLQVLQGSYVCTSVYRTHVSLQESSIKHKLGKAISNSVVMPPIHVKLYVLDVIYMKMCIAGKKINKLPFLHIGMWKEVQIRVCES